MFWVIAARLAAAGGRRPRRLAGRGRRLARAVRPAGPQHRDRPHDADQRPQGRRRRSPRRCSWSRAGAAVRARLLPAAAGHLAAACRRCSARRWRSRSTACWSRRPRSTCSPTASSWRSTGSGTTCGSTAILLGVAKCVLPFLLAGAGALGPLRLGRRRDRCCARVASLWVIFRHLPGRGRSRRRSELLRRPRLRGGGLRRPTCSTVLPLLVFPLLVINALGLGRRGGVLHQLPDRDPAERGHPGGRPTRRTPRASAPPTGRHARRPQGRDDARWSCSRRRVRWSMFVLAPYFLLIFGDHYVERGHRDAAGARASPRSAPPSTTGARSGCGSPPTCAR